MLAAARDASRKLGQIDDYRIEHALNCVADEIERNIPALLEANNRDLTRMRPDDPKFDRLQLTAGRLYDIAADMRRVSTLPSPQGQILQQSTRPNGMQISRVRVPFGVVAVIYEARPNVTFDVFALCLKSGNACVLKGGSDADESNRAAATLIRQTLSRLGFDPNTLTLLPSERESTAQLLRANDYVDLLIPRGSAELISYVRQHATVPVIETGAGVCHLYVDSAANRAKAAALINNAKTRRVSVCNALDCMLVHADRLADLPELCRLLAESQVQLYADGTALEALRGSYPEELLHEATPESFGTEFLDYKLAIRTVGSLDEALEHIRRYSSRHSECIVTEDPRAAERFTQEVDSACVYVNVSTAFTDGGQFGLGAEVGISTQKMHARGPMGLEALTTYKWIIEGNGQIRPC